MKFSTKTARTLAIGVLALTLGASLAAAQDTLTPTADPTYGGLTLTDGFQPDPYIRSLYSGGALDAGALNLDASCRGYIAAAPDFRVTWDGAGPLLRFFFAAAGDTTLVVTGPNGQTTCNDDASGLNPLVEIAAPAKGDYNVWVGSYAEGEFFPGYLMVSAQPGTGSAPIQSSVLSEAVGAEVPVNQTTDTPAASALNPDVEATFGNTTLAPGFSPDPFTIEILSGGEVNVSLLSLGAGCVGYAASEPDFSLNVSGPMPRLSIGFTSEDDIDTTLIVRGPSGAYTCNDDTNGVDPEIALSNVAAGQYDIWVGTYIEDFSFGSLYVTQGGAPVNNTVPTATPVNSNGVTPVTGATTVPAIPSATPVAPGK